MPFISQEGINFLMGSIQNRAYKIEKISIKLLICDSPKAYRSGTLDAKALLEFSKQRNVEIAAFGDGLHAKAFLIDNSMAIVTSANLTNGGLKGNLEIGFKISDKGLIDTLSKEFEIAWEAAEPLTLKDLKKRLDWSNTSGNTQEDEKPTFRKKIRWRPVNTSGTGTSYGIEIFNGFNKSDFEILDPKYYGGSIQDIPANQEIVEKLKETIEKQTKPLLNKFYIAVKDYLPRDEFLYPHYASRKRVKNFYPSAAWLGLGRNVRRYVTLAQLSVGLFVDKNGQGLFTNFNIGEEYEINEDRNHFMKWIRRNKSYFIEALSHLNTNFKLHYNHPDNGVINLSVNEVTPDEIDEILSIDREHLLDFHIERRYMLGEEWQLLKKSTVVWEVADQFEVLYPIYLKAFKE